MTRHTRRSFVAGAPLGVSVVLLSAFGLIAASMLTLQLTWGSASHPARSTVRTSPVAKPSGYGDACMKELAILKQTAHPCADGQPVGISSGPGVVSTSAPKPAPPSRVHPPTLVIITSHPSLTESITIGRPKN